MASTLIFRYTLHMNSNRIDKVNSPFIFRTKTPDFVKFSTRFCHPHGKTHDKMYGIAPSFDVLLFWSVAEEVQY